MGNRRRTHQQHRGVWSLFKRSIVGSFHKMSEALDRYLEDGSGAMNRDNPNIFRDTLARIVNTDPLTYRELVA